MKRFVAGLLEVAVFLAILSVGVSAAPAVAEAAGVGPYEGTFEGVAYGDRGSRAPLALELTHRGSQVEGTVSLGEGLYVDGGWCGEVNLPAISTDIEGQTSRWSPRRLAVSPRFDVGGFDLTVDFESNVSTNGKVITAQAKVDLPWFCGRDPVLTATMYRE
jgi:hypothetical protein